MRYHCVMMGHLIAVNDYNMTSHTTHEIFDTAVV